MALNRSPEPFGQINPFFSVHNFFLLTLFLSQHDQLFYLSNHAHNGTHQRIKFGEEMKKLDCKQSQITHFSKFKGK